MSETLPTPLVRALARLYRQQHVAILQAGACTGQTAGDELSLFIRSRSLRPGLQAVVVEPDPGHFARLCAHYEGRADVVCVRAALADVGGEAAFYRLDVDPREHGMPEWLEELGSLRPERMTELWDRYEKEPALREFYLAHRVVEPVPCLTANDLLEHYGFQRLDLLHLDTEGSDHHILRALDFERFRPRYINYERVLLFEEEPSCRRLLESQGYTLEDHGQDTLATLCD